MSSDPRHVLLRWNKGLEQAALEPLGAGSGFSGARLWKVSRDGEQFVLRRWPRSAGSACRIGSLYELQSHLAGRGLPVPRPVLMSDGAGILRVVDSDRIGVTWGLSTWLPGIADYWSRPSVEKLNDALATLAHLHVQAADYPRNDKRKSRRMDCSPSAQTRFKRLTAIAEGGMTGRRHGLHHADESLEKELGAEALALIERNLAAQRRAAEYWSAVQLPLQWRLGDVWHDHVLFTGDHVTGIIDFGAAGIDSPAGDVARLLGSLVGDDRERWRAGLAAYESVRPMVEEELAAVEFFDTTGTVLSAANWVGWLWPQYPAAFPFEGNRTAGVARLRRLVERLRVLAARGG